MGREGVSTRGRKQIWDAPSDSRKLVMLKKKRKGTFVEFTLMRKSPVPLGFSGEGLGLEKDVIFLLLVPLTSLFLHV